MSKVQLIDQPRRWDLPFSRDLPNVRERRDMSDLDVDRLMSIEPFAHIAAESFPKHLSLRDLLRNDTRIRHYRHGDVIVRQGDYGNSAFLILEGQARVVLGLDPGLLGRPERQRKNVLRSLAKLFTNPSSPEVRDARRYPQMQRGTPPSADEDDGERVFVQDVTSVLNVSSAAINKADQHPMDEGELFGELAALGRIARTATVVAEGEATLLEIRWQGLRDLRKYDEALREHVDERFRKFGLAAALQASPLLAHLNDDEAKQVADTAEFETYGSFDWYGTYQQMRSQEVDPLSQEPIIAEQGHYPNGLILVRTGFARLSRTYGSGEQTFSYLGKGDVYGLAESAHNATHEQQVPLTATLRAIGYVDVVRISTKTFERMILPNMPTQMLAALPDVSAPASAAGGRPGAGGVEVSLPIANADRPVAPRAEEPKIDSAMMEFLVENRFINGTATMMIDLDRCTRCDDCVRACAGGHDNNPRFVRHGKVFDHFMVANACMHCADPVCLIGCPTGAIHRFAEGGEVSINDVTCIGCGVCAGSCPYDNIRMVEVRDQAARDAIMVDPAKGKPIVKATKCDLCVDHHGGPGCERACPHDALKRLDMRDLDQVSAWLHR